MPQSPLSPSSALERARASNANRLRTRTTPTLLRTVNVELERELDDISLISAESSSHNMSFGNIVESPTNYAVATSHSSSSALFIVTIDGTLGSFQSHLKPKALEKPLKDALIIPFLQAAAQGGTFPESALYKKRPTCSAVEVNGVVCDVSKKAKHFVTDGGAEVVIYVDGVSPNSPSSTGGIQGAYGGSNHSGDSFDGAQSFNSDTLPGTPSHSRSDSGASEPPPRQVSRPASFSSGMSASPFSSFGSQGGGRPSTVWILTLEAGNDGVQTKLASKALNKSLKDALIVPFVQSAAQGGSFRSRINGQIIKQPVIQSVTIDGQPIDISRPARTYADRDRVEVVLGIQEVNVF